jgi:methionine aminopeptidase
MIVLKSPSEIASMRRAGRILAEVLDSGLTRSGQRPDVS